MRFFKQENQRYKYVEGTFSLFSKLEDEKKKCKKQYADVVMGHVIVMLGHV